MNQQNLISINHIIEQFQSWLNEAKNHKNIVEYNAVNIATANKQGKPSNRTVLLKEFNEKGFIFYTNLKSQKGLELMENPYASMCFYWDPLKRQVRISGKLEKVSDETADKYYNSRDYRSKLGAHISKQSTEVESYQKLQLQFAKRVAQFSAESEIKRPDWWSGFRLIPDYFEFWQEGNFRIHKREVYKKQTETNFTKHYLYP